MDEGALPGHVRAMDRPRVPGGMDRRRLKGEIGGRHIVGIRKAPAASRSPLAARESVRL